MQPDLILMPVIALVLLTAGVAIRLFTLNVMAFRNRVIPTWFFWKI